MKQHTFRFEQLAELVQERAAPWHCPMAVHAGVVPPGPPSGAQHTWVEARQVEAPHAMPPPPDEPLLDDDPDPPLLDPDPPLLDAEPPLEVDPDPPLLDPEADPDPPLDPDSTEASVSTPGIRGTTRPSSGLRDPHPTTSKAVMVNRGLMGFMSASSNHQ